MPTGCTNMRTNQSCTNMLSAVLFLDQDQKYRNTSQRVPPQAAYIFNVWKSPWHPLSPLDSRNTHVYTTVRFLEVILMQHTDSIQHQSHKTPGPLQLPCRTAGKCWCFPSLSGQVRRGENLRCHPSVAVPSVLLLTVHWNPTNPQTVALVEGHGGEAQTVWW